MVGDMDNTGSLNAQVIHQLTDRVRSKVAMQVYGVANLCNACYSLRYRLLPISGQICQSFCTFCLCVGLIPDFFFFFSHFLFVKTKLKHPIFKHFW